MASPTPSPGHPTTLVEKQRTALETLKTRLVAEGVYTTLPDDGYLCRFLRARDFDVGKAFVMLKKATDWRDEVGMDKRYAEWDMTKDERRKITSAWPQFFHKTAKSGQIIYIQRCNLDTTAFFEATDEKRAIEMLTVDFESVLRARYPAATAAAGHDCSSTFIIMDMQGMSLWSFYRVKSVLVTTIQMSQDIWPETSGAIRIINAGVAARVGFEALKYVIAAQTLSKIKMYGTDYLPKLLEEVDPENLPKVLGGECDCPGGCLHSDIGPWSDGDWEMPGKAAKAVGSAAVAGSTEPKEITA